MSTDITTTSTSTSLVKRAGLIALFAVLALLMGAKFTGALISGPASSGHSSTAAYAYSSTTIGAPTNVAATGSATGTVTVTWNNPQLTGVPITSYIVTNANGSATLCTQTNVTGAGLLNSCTWTPTSAIGAQTLHVYSVGTATSVSDGTGVAVTTLGQPTLTSVTPYNGTTVVAYTANATANTFKATSFKVYNNGVVVCTTTSATSCTINNSAAGLTNGQSYDFTVVAVNAVGNSTASSVVSATPGATPSAPSNASVVVDSANSTLDVTYTASTSNGGSALTYTVGLAKNGVSYYFTVQSADATYNAGTHTGACSTATLVTKAITATCAITWTQLPAALFPYSGPVTVTATNGTGLSASTATSAITLQNIAAAPTNVGVAINATETSTTYGTATITWGKSSSVTGYSVQLEKCSTTSNTTCALSGSPVFVVQPASGSTVSTQFSVTPGSAWNALVSAITPAGTGLAGTSASAVNFAVGAPQQTSSTVTVTGVTNSTLTVTWTAPVKLAGNTVSSYSLKLYAGVGGAQVGATVSKTVAGTYTFTGLTPNYPYTVGVTPNYLSTGGASTAGGEYKTATATYVGMNPTGLVAAYTSTGMSFSWTAATAPLVESSYTVEANGTVICTSTSTSCTATTAAIAAIAANGALSGGSAYLTIGLFATDANGVSGNAVNFADNTSASLGGNYSGTLAAPGAPTAYEAVDVNGNVNVVWAAVTGATSYTLVASGSDGSVVTKTTSGTSAYFAGLEATYTYTFTIAASNAAGSSANTAMSSKTTLTTAAQALPSNPVVLTSAIAAADTTNIFAGGATTANAASPTMASLSTTNNTLITHGQGGLASLLTAAGVNAYTMAPVSAPGAGGGVIEIKWEKSSGTAAASSALPITSYTATLVEASGLTLTCTTPATQTLVYQTYTLVLPYNYCDFYGVPAGQKYTVTVVANNAFGSSDATVTTASASITNPLGSGAPTSVAAKSAANGQSIVVTWAAPTTNPQAVLGYQILLSDTTAGTRYVACDNNALAYVPAATLTATCTATAGDAYTVTVIAVSGILGIPSTYTSALVVTGGATDALITLAEKFNVSTSGDPSTSNSATATVTVNNKPNQMAAPTVAVAGSGMITVTWVAPANNGSSITSYLITPSSATNVSGICTTATGSTAVVNGSGVITVSVGVGSPTSVTCSGYTVLSTATFKISATNGVHASVDSPNSAAISEVSTSAALGTVNYAKNADGSYTIGWSSTADTGATGYTVTVYGGSSPVTYTTTAQSYVVPASSLTAGVVYTFTVAANNSLGAGIAKNASLYAVAPTAPSYDHSVSSNVGVNENFNGATAATSTSMTLNWFANGSGSMPVTYSVYATVSGILTQLTTGLTATSYTVSNYSSTTMSGFTVYAVTSAGISTAALGDSHQYFLSLAPTKPTIASFGSSITSSAATLSWTAGDTTTPSSTLPITGYVVSITSASGTSVSCVTPVIETSTSCVLALLSPATTYNYSVAETSAYGTSLALTGSFTTLDVAPGTPTITNVVVTQSYYTTAKDINSIAITWKAPTNLGSPITSYIVTASDGTNTAVCESVLTGSSTSCVIDNTNNNTISLNKAAGVTVSVAAVNGYGASAVAATNVDSLLDPVLGASGAVSAINASNTPDSVEHASGSSYGTAGIDLTYPGLGSVTAVWKAGSANANPVVSYTCTATALGKTTVTVSVPAPATSCTLTGLENIAYTISVYAVNTYGLTAATNTSSAAQALSSPYTLSAPANFGAASVAGGSISAQWIAPIQIPGTSNSTAVTGYTVTATDASGNSFTCTAAASDKLCTVTGLANLTTYTVTVTPVAGTITDSVVASVTAKTIASSAPTAPSISSVTSTATGLSVTWTAPTSLGSAAKLVGYWVTATDVLSLKQSTCAYNATYGVILAPATTCEISSLTVGGNYTVSVTAIAVDANLAKLLSPAATKVAIFTGVNPKPVIATFSAVTAKQKSVSALTAAAKAALVNLISNVNDGAKITVTGYGTTKAIALARANAAASYLFNNGAAVHVTIKSVVSKTIKTALVTVTSN